MVDDFQRVVTEDDLRRAVAAGRAHEGDHLDIKRELPAGSQATTAIATDLASFAINGGVIVVGLTPARPPALEPVVLRGQEERIQQIARDRVDPPLRVAVREIPSVDAADRGYLIVTVPATGDPHAVDGAFRGRRGTVNIRLSAAEVRASYERGDPARPPLSAALTSFEGRDPFPPDRQRLGRLRVIARPTGAPPRMLDHALGDGWAAWIERNVRSGPALTAGFSPDFGEAWNVRRMPDGWIASRFEVPHRPGDRDWENHGIEIELDEDGSIRVFCSRATDDFRDHPVAFEPAIVGLVLRTVWLAGIVSQDASYAGDWEFGVSVTGLAGTTSFYLAQRLIIGARDALPYPDDRYERVWRGGTADLTDPNSVADVLVGPLSRALNDGAFRLGFAD